MKMLRLYMGIGERDYEETINRVSLSLASTFNITDATYIKSTGTWKNEEGEIEKENTLIIEIGEVKNIFPWDEEDNEEFTMKIVQFLKMMFNQQYIFLTTHEVTAHLW